MSGLIKMWTNFENLRLKSKNAPTTEIKKTRNVSGLQSRKDRVISSEIDLRGQASDEAIKLSSWHFWRGRKRCNHSTA